MSFILKWLGFLKEKPAGISVRPSRTFDIDLAYDAAVERCVRGLEDVLGAQVRELDRERGTVEASFGLMFSERVACSLQRAGADATQVTLESRRIAGSELPKNSAVLDRLERWMREGR
ncbi:MAG: hypothetical protein M3126_11160 [Candidatus Eremiobacteraeota bacterium]|nr:hypothetical protein [Candidatus Eremiobacteraeota bacterium]